MTTIRKATAQDSDGIWRIFQQVVAAGDTYTYPADMTREQALEAWLHRDGNHTFVAIDSDGIIGGTYYVRQNWPGAGSHIANASFMVGEDSRGAGIGRKMAEHALVKAKELGFIAMQFNLVISTNSGAIALWKKLGFETIGTVPQAFKHPSKGLVDALIMYRKL